MIIPTIKCNLIQFYDLNDHINIIFICKNIGRKSKKVKANNKETRQTHGGWSTKNIVCLYIIMFVLLQILM